MEHPLDGLTNLCWRALLEQHKDFVASGAVTPADFEMLACYQAASYGAFDLNAFYEEHKHDWDDAILPVAVLDNIFERTYAIAATIKGMRVEDFKDAYQRSLDRFHSAQGFSDISGMETVHQFLEER